jgi:endonuclease III
VIWERELTKYNRTTEELEEFILFAITVAGHNANTTAHSLEKLLTTLNFPRVSPFHAIRYGIRTRGKHFPELIQECGIGCFNQRARSYQALVESNINLHSCSVDELEEIPGIGKKTSRFYMLHSREGYRGAALDTHILKFLRESGVPDVPKTTPGSKKTYQRLEQAFLELVPPGIAVADFDLNIWKRYSAAA